MTGLFHSFFQIKDNWDSYVSWDKKWDEKEAKRRILYDSMHFKQEDLERARNYSFMLNNVIDVMDRNSEESSTNVQVVVNPISFLLGMSAFLPGLTGFIKSFGKGITAYKGYENQINQISKKAHLFEIIEYLNKSPSIPEEIRPKVYEFVKNRKNEIKISDIPRLVNENFKAHVSDSFPDLLKKDLEKQSENILQNLKKNLGIFTKKEIELLPEINEQVGKLQKEFIKIEKGHLMMFGGCFAAMTIGALALQCLGIYIETRLQVLASRIAHYQSQRDLADPKNFVVFSKYQINQAKKLLKSRRLDKELEQEEKKKGVMDKIPVISFIKGFFENVVSLIMDYKEYSRWNEQKDKEYVIPKPKPTRSEMEKAKKDQDILLRIMKEINEKAEDYSVYGETAVQTLVNSAAIGGFTIGVLGDVLAKKFKIGDAGINEFSKTLKSLEITKFAGELGEKIIDQVLKGPIRSVITGILSSFFVSLLAAPITLWMRNNSVHVARYKARQALEKDPKNYIYIADNRLKTVKKPKLEKDKGFFSEIIEDFKFIPKIIVETNEFIKYKEVGAKEEEKLRKALKKIPVSPAQMAEAKNFQRKIFMTFNKIDENSQEYSEDMEAATQMAMQAIGLISPLIFYAPLWASALMFGLAIYKGKITPNNVLKNVTGWLAKTSRFFETKIFKNYLNEVQANLEHKAVKSDKKQVLEWLTEKLAPIKPEEIENWIEKAKFNAKIFTPQVVLNKVDFHLTNLETSIMKLNEKNFYPDLTKYIQENLPLGGHIVKGINNMDLKTLNKSEALDITKNFKTIAQNMPKDEIDNIIRKFTYNPYNIISYLKEGKPMALILSPTLAKTLATAGIAWYAGNFIIIYLINNYLAELQKRAGRIGVMKAIQEIEDPRYFVDKYEVPVQKTNRHYMKKYSNNNYFKKVHKIIQ